MPSWSEHLSAVLSDQEATVSEALITHWHHDHVGGVNDLLRRCPDAKIYKHMPSAGQLDIINGQIFPTSGAKLRAFHSPGHTEDHMVFILEEENALFTGDNVLGHGTAVFGDLAVYLHSLRQMKQQVSGRAYPAHGPLIQDSQKKIQEYLAHRQQREEQVLATLQGAEAEAVPDEKASSSSIARTPRELVKIIYTDVPENLHDAAEHGVRQILQKLQAENKVAESADGGVWHLVSGIKL